MKYKGYTAKIEYDDYDDIFHGYILTDFRLFLVAGGRIGGV